MSDNTKRTIRATVTSVYSHAWKEEIAATGDDGAKYLFFDDIEASGRRWWFKTWGSRIDFVVIDKPFDYGNGVTRYDLALDHALRVDDAD